MCKVGGLLSKAPANSARSLAGYLPHLCEPFYRVDSTRSGGSNHAGLGLALAAWIAQAHGGHLAVESRIGLGSVFTLSLPLRELASLA
jgi:signal transduction histidine kinase